jgi:hypothetical protein
MNGAFGATSGNYGNPAFHGFMPNKSAQLAANALYNVQQPDYPIGFDQYTGDPMTAMAEIIWQVGIMDNAEFLLSDILPVQETDKMTADMAWMYFEPKLMDTNPEWSAAKLISFGRRQKRKRLTRRGIMIEMEQGFASEAYGREVFGRYIDAIVLAQKDTLCVDILMALQNAPLETDELWQGDPRWKGQSVANALADEVFFHGVIQIEDRPFEAMDSKIRANMGFVNGKYDTLIVPSRVTGFVKAAKNTYLDYYTAGVSGPALSKTNPDNADSRGLYPGISGDLIVPLKPSYEQSKLTGGHSLMSAPMAVGEYYRCFSHIDFSSKHWTPDNQAIEIYDETDSTRKKIRLIEIIQNSRLFDERTGELRPLEKLPYQDPELKVDNREKEGKGKREDGIFDMFTEENGVRATRLFGNIHPRFLHGGDVIDWAKKAVSLAKKEIRFSETDWRDIDIALGTEGKPEDVAAATVVKVKRLERFVRNSFPRNPLVLAIAREEAEQRGAPAQPAPGPQSSFFRTFLTSHLPSIFRSGSGAVSGGDERVAVLRKIFGSEGLDLSEISQEKAIAASHLWASFRAANRTDSVSADHSVSQIESARKALKLSTEQKRAASSLHAKTSTILQSASSGEWVKDSESMASEEMARGVYDSWRRNPGTVPNELPGNPEYPEIPATLTVLGEYFGSYPSKTWPKQALEANFIQPYLHSRMMEHYRLSRLSEKSGSSAYDVLQAHLQEEGSPLLQQKLTQFSIGVKKAENEDLVDPFGPRNRSQFTQHEKLLEDLRSMTEGSFQDKYKAIMSMSMGLVALFAGLFITTEVHEESFVRWAQAGLPLPVQGVIMRPNITHWVSSAIACMRGRKNLGYMAIGKGNFTYGSDPTPQSFLAHFTFYCGSIIEKTFNVSVMPAITVDQYVGGKGCKWIVPDTEIKFKSQPEESMYGLVIPLRAQMPFVTSITGSTFDLPETQKQQLAEEPYFPQALRFRMTNGTKKMLDDMGENQQTAPNPRNFVMFPGTYWFRAESEFMCKHIGKGHFKGTDGPEAKAIRSGALKQYPKDLGGNNAY